MASTVINRHRAPTNAAAFQKILDENAQLIQTIGEFQQTGRVTEAQQLQQLLHRNLIQLATVTDSALLAELQSVPLSDIQPTAPQPTAQRRDSTAATTPSEQQPAAPTTPFTPQQVDGNQAQGNTTPADKENRPAAATYASPTESRAPLASSQSAGPYYSSAESQPVAQTPPHHAPAGHAVQYDQQQAGQQQQQQPPAAPIQSYSAPANPAVSMQQQQQQQPMQHQQMGPPQQPMMHQGQQQQQQPPAPIQHQHSHQQPPQQSSALQQQLHMTPSTGYQQQPHQYYNQPQYQQSMPYHQQQQQQQQQMVGSGGTGYPSMARPGFQAPMPPQQQQAPQQPDGGYYNSSQQRYQYPMATAQTAPHSGMYQQQPMPPPAAQPYGTSAYQQQPVRQPTSGYGAPASGYGYQQQPGGAMESQPPQQMGPPQNYPQAYHQGNFQQPQVTSAQQMHYPTPNSNA